jgi:hypothetical protein
MANPDNIAFGTGSTAAYFIFNNVLESNDWLIAAEGYVNYITTPSYTANQAFVFELLDNAGTTTYASTSLQSYGDRPIGIYLSASQASAISLVIGTAYTLRITGNPLIFASPVGNTVSVHMAASDYIDQDLQINPTTPTDSQIYNNLITMAQQIQLYDYPLGPPSGDEYVTVQTVNGYYYLTSIGGSIFTQGIPGLTSMCPVLFQYALQPLANETPTAQGALQNALSPQSQWGNTIATGLTNIGSYLGLSQAMAGSAVLFGLVLMFAIWVYQKTQSGIVVLLMVASTPFIGSYLGLMPIALAFVVVIIIVTLLGYFFFSRGAL